MRQSAYYFSGGFHVLIILVFTWGFAMNKDRELLPPPPMVVEFVKITQETKTPEIAKPTPKPPKPPTPEAKPKPPKPAQSLPDKKASVAPDSVPMPNLDKPKPPKKPEEKKVEKPKDTPKPEAQKGEQGAENKQEFSSLLKNLVGEEAEQPTPEKVEEPKLNLDEKPVPVLGQYAPIGERLTVSEHDALRRQIERCWNIPIGAKDAENLIVDVQLVVNPDRTIQSAVIVDQDKYRKDSFFRAAADSAIRAIRNPMCSPLALPQDKYEQWKNMTISFNPKDML